MKKTLLSIALFLVPFVCQAAEPSKTSIENLFILTKTQSLLESMLPQMEAGMRTGMNHAIEAKKLAPAEEKKARASAEALLKKMMPIFKKQMDWQKVKDILIPIYAESFSQEDIDGLIAFYNSPAGKAFTEKMPVVLQKTMAATQQLMGPMMAEMQKAMTEFAEEAGKTSEPAP